MASRWGNITEFRGFDLITPNEREARFALGDQDFGIRPLAAESTMRRKCKTLILKLGDKGVLTCRHGDHQALDSFFVIDSFVDRLVDGVGAGDALLAYATLSMLASKCEFTATIIGTHGRGLRMREGRQHPDQRRRRSSQARRRRARSQIRH